MICSVVVFLPILLQCTLCLGFINILNHQWCLRCGGLNHMMSSNSNERLLHVNYLIGLRKTRNYIRNSTRNVEYLRHILNTTTRYVNSTYDSKVYKINNTDVRIKIGKNIFIEVSNVKNIEISTNNDNMSSISIETHVENNKKEGCDNVSLFDKINNVEILLNTFSLLNQFLNHN